MVTGVIAVVAVVVGVVLVSPRAPSGPTEARPPGTDAVADETSPASGETWPNASGPSVSAAAFPNEPWAQDLLRRPMWVLVPDERFGWVNGDLDVSNLSVRDGRRVTVEVNDPEFTVWLFGGSTVYGFGQRDQGTIASRLVQLADQAGVRLEVVNFGVPAYVNVQETSLFGSRLLEGSRPDLAVFLDGANEVGASYERELFGLFDPHEDVIKAATRPMEQERRRDVAARGYEMQYDRSRQIRLTAVQYRRGVRRGEMLGARYGVEVLHFWQPWLATIPVDRPAVDDVIDDVGNTIDDLEQAGLVSSEALAEARVDNIDLSRMFARTDHPVFFDWSNTNEAGARDLAEAMLGPILARLGS